jgi:tripartite-type tricarboxylate transporter receptor subunit TctC
MKTVRQQIVRAATAVAVVLGLAHAPAHAQPPAAGGADAKAPLKLIVGFPPGGPLDTLARALAEQLRTATGETVLVDNRPGASTRIAIDLAKRAPADGRTVLLASSAPFIMFPMTYKRLDYDVERDFLPVAHLVDVPTVVSTSASSPYQNIGQYVAWVRAHPDRGAVGLTSLGGLLHFSILAMSKTIGVPLNPVSYKGGAPLATDLVGGHVPIGTDALASQLELHRAGRVRILAVSGTRRNRALPDVPTLKEAGIDGFDHANAWYGAYVPAGTPPAVVQRLERALIAAVGQPQVQAQLARVGLEPTGFDGATAAKQLRTERTFWRPIVEASGFKSEE